MKHLLACILMLSFASLATAGEVDTECVMMKEQNERTNPKANLNATKIKPKAPKGSSAQ